MLTIQEVGQEVLTGTPKKFYVFVGSEYGVKEKYIELLSNHYGRKVESESVQDILNIMKTRHIIPLQPTLYVVRYDESFISTLSNSTAVTIANTNIVGTIVCIYEQAKHVNRLEKHLSNFTVSLDKVSPQFTKKYLKTDFSDLSDRFIDIAVQTASDYGQAKNMCRSMQLVPDNMLQTLSDTQVAQLFGYQSISTESLIRIGVASRNFSYLLNVIEDYEDAGDRVLYAILQTMIELDKLMDNSRTQSDIRNYVKCWTREDIYNMFMNTYDELTKLRSYSSYDVQNSIMYLLGLLQFKQIPSLEVMS